MSDNDPFFVELRRRKVFQTGATYVVTALALWGAVEVASGAFGWTDRVLQLVIVGSLVGLPIALLVAWGFQVHLEPALHGPLTWRRAGIGGITVLATWGVMLTGWVLFSGSRQRTMETIATEVVELSNARLWDSAFAVAETGLSDGPEYEAVWNRASRAVDISSEPQNATVYRQRYDPGGEPWELLGTTPIRGVRVPLGMSSYRLELEGYTTVERALLSGEVSLATIPLPRAGEVPAGMVFVPTGQAVLPGTVGQALRDSAGIVPPIEAFLIDRYEVTNRQYKEFVDAGGYDDSSYWDSRFELDGDVLPWSEARERFVDQSDRPGPSAWLVGDYPSGADDLPVQGISWFEARAYARFVGKELPTYFHWHRAAEAREAAYVVPVSSFGGDGPRAVGVAGGMTIFGTVGMAGNVREWVSNASGHSRFILGGAWDDPTYLFSQHYAESPWDRSQKNGLRLVRYLSDADLAEMRRPLEVPLRDYSVEQPVSDAVFEAFRGAYEYDLAPLNAEHAPPDTTEDWVRQRVSFDAAYGDERVIADLYLPKDREPPYQTVVYFPGSAAITSTLELRNPADLSRIDFLLRDGRAVMTPAYSGMFERRDSTLLNSGPHDTNRYAEFVTQWVKDLGRSIDYLETRDDVDVSRLAYYGFSFGGRMAPIMLAMEPRLSVAVLYLPGLYSERPLPAADVINFLPRVRVPVRMINGRDDHRFPYVYQVPFYRLLGTPEADKDHAVFPGGHYVARADLVRETIQWLDRYLGPTG